MINIGKSLTQARFHLARLQITIVELLKSLSMNQTSTKAAVPEVVASKVRRSILLNSKITASNCITSQLTKERQRVSIDIMKGARVEANVPTTAEAEVSRNEPMVRRVEAAGTGRTLGKAMQILMRT